eukprot:gene14231-18169_t
MTIATILKSGLIGLAAVVALNVHAADNSTPDGLIRQL